MCNGLFLFKLFFLKIIFKIILKYFCLFKGKFFEYSEE